VTLEAALLSLLGLFGLAQGLAMLLWLRRQARRTAALERAVRTLETALTATSSRAEALAWKTPMAEIEAQISTLKVSLETALLLKAQVELTTQGLLLVNDRLASIERLEHETTTWRRDLQAGSPSQVALGELGIGLSARIADLERDLQAYGPSHVHEWRLVSVEESGGHRVQIRRCTSCDRLDRWIVP
jgi:hypothetical protein